MEPLKADGIGTQLRRLVEMMDGDLDALYREDHPFYSPRFTPIMKALAANDRLTIKDIAAQSNISHSAASQTVSLLIKKGIVISVEDDDRRSRVVSLTVSGSAMLPWLEQWWQATKRAAVELDDELSYPLSALLSETIRHLEDWPFAERIRANKTISKEGETMLRILMVGAGLLAAMTTPSAAAPTPGKQASEAGTITAQKVVVLPTAKRTVLDQVLVHLREEYVDPEVGISAAKELQKLRKAGHFEKVKGAEAFAKRLSKELQRLTGDGHLNVEFSRKKLDLEAPADDSFSDAEMEKYYGRSVNFGVQKIEHLDGNIGYLDLRVFAPIEMGGPSVTSAMSVLAPTSALIIDLRKNGGGIGDMADLVASYLFDGGRQQLTGVYDRPSDTLTQRFTQPHVPGERFGSHKPVYILTSKQTFSAAEALAYNLQALGRATIVGETSGGGAHPFEYKPIHEHFVLWSVTAKSVNPITKTNWQGVGVTPDVEVPAEQALERSLTLARAEIAKEDTP